MRTVIFAAIAAMLAFAPVSFAADMTADQCKSAVEDCKKGGKSEDDCKKQVQTDHKECASTM